MDVVVPVRPTRPNPDHLKWVIRSWAANFPVTRLYIVGSLPDFFDPAEVEFISTAQDLSKFWNIGRNLYATLTSDVDDQFVWINDDFFLLKKKRKIQLTNRGPWDDVISFLGEPRGTHLFQDYVKGFRSQRDILRAWGFDTAVEPCVDLHTPLELDKARMLDVLTRMVREYPEHWTGHFRGLYGAGLPSERIADPKVKKDDQLPDPSWWTASVGLNAWSGAAGEMLRETFAKKSRFEK